MRLQRGGIRDEHVDKPWSRLVQVCRQELNVGDVAERGLIPSEELLLPLNTPIELPHLGEPDHGLQVGELEVEPERHMLVDPGARAPEVAQLVNAPDQIIVVGDERASLPGGDDFRRAERETADPAERAQVTSMPAGAERLSTVLEDG